MESTQGILCVDFDKSHHMILAGSSDHAIRLWEISSGKLQQSLTGHVGKVHSALFLNHQCVISGGHDRTIKIWDLNRGYCTKTIFTVSSCNTISTTDDQG
jgi:autophagy-related protein 16